MSFAKKLSITTALIVMAGTAAADEIKITSGGTSAMYLLNPVKDAFEKSSGHKLTIKTAGGRFAMVDVDSGSAELGAAAHTKDELESFLKKDGIAVSKVAEIQEFPMAPSIDYTLAVHKDNPVGKLDKEQIKGIYTGKITNWKDVGGKDAPILIVLPKFQPAANQLLQNKFLDKQPQTTDVLEVNVYDDVKQNVASNPEAIGVMMKFQAEGGVKSLDIPKFSTGPITFYTLGEPSPKVKQLLAFVKSEGQKFLPK